MSESKRAKVVEAYESRSADGLSLVPGEEVEVLDSRDSYWWLGRVKGRTGLFPSSRVAVVDEGASSSIPPRRDKVVVAVYAFEATSSDELGFVAGEQIEVLGRSKSGWWKGRIGLREGLFPVNRTTGDDGREARQAELMRKEEELKKKKAAVEEERRARSEESEEGRSASRVASIRAARDPPKTNSVDLSSGGTSPRGSPMVGQRETSPRLTAVPANVAKADEGKRSPMTQRAGDASLECSSKSTLPALTAVKTDEAKRSPMMPRLPEEKLAKTKESSPGKETLGASGSGFRSPSPRRMLELLKSKIGSKSKDLDIEHPFEQPVQPSDGEQQDEKDHFSLLQVDAAATLEKAPVVREDPEIARRKRHGFILTELVETEEDYVNDCEMIVELFLVPLRINKVISKDEADNVFLNLPHLIPINRDLLDKIRAQLSLPIEQQRVGALFNSFFSSDSIKEYTKYASQSMLSGRTLLALSKTNPQWARFLEETYRNPALRDLKLDTYLIKPVQRVCRYPLLLGELQRACPDACVDKKDLLAAIECLGEVIRVINETRRESELLHHVVQLENSLKNLPADLRLVAPGRTFVREAQMERVRKKNARRRAVTMVWMFSDCLLWGQVKAKVSLCKGVAMLNASLLHDVADNPAKEIEHAFEVMTFPSRESVILCCSSSAQKTEWMKDLTETIDRNLQREAQKTKSHSSASPSQPSVSSAPSATVIDTSPVAAASSEPSKEGGVSFESMLAGGKPRKKTLNAPLMRATQQSVRVKGAELSARVTRLRDEMSKAGTGVEMMESDGERYFSGRVAIEWTMARFNLPPEKFGAAMELMVGLLRSGVIEPVLETPGDDFLFSFTAYYSFVQAT